jgi:hypothetical protein
MLVLMGKKRKRVGRGTKKYRVIAQIQRGKLPSKQSLKLINLYHTGRISGENISF